MATVSAQTSIAIKATPKQVFKYIGDLKYHYYWNPILRSITPEGILKQGFAYDTESVIFGNIHLKCHNVVTELVPDQRLHLKNELGNIKYNHLIHLNPKDDGTEVNCSIDILTSSKHFGLTLGVLTQIARHELQSDLEALKLAVENKLGQ